MDGPNPKTSRGPLLAVVAIVMLLVGTGAGVVLDRFVLRPAPSRPAIVGKWVGTVDNDNIAFNADGTHDWEKSFLDATGNQNRWVWKPAPSAQWRWLDEERIEIVGVSNTPETLKVVVAGDALKLLKPDGGVREYRRK